MKCFGKKLKKEFKDKRPPETPQSKRNTTTTHDNDSSSASTRKRDSDPYREPLCARDRAVIDWRKSISERYEHVKTRYDMKSCVGEGGYAKVFVGNDLNVPDGRLVAIKIIKKSSKLKQTYAREITVMKTLDHPNICRLIETFEDKTFIFFVMEYCEGGELFDVIVDNQFISEVMAANITHQIASALNYCHKRNIVHRDLKPENVCFCTKKYTPESIIKVIDWGLAGFTQHSLEMRTAVGSVPYAAPEILKSESYSHACDLWSLGVLVYVMVSGQPPFWGPMQKMVPRICEAKYPRLEKKIANDFVERLLVVDPLKRMTLEEAFEHEWLADVFKHEKLDPIHSQAVLKNLYRYKDLSNFKVMCTMAVARQMDHKKLTDIHRIFRELDTNSDGELSMEEIKKGFKRLYGSEAGTDYEIEEMFNAINVSGAGSLDYTEFCAAALTPGPTEFEDDVLWAAFRSFDANGDGLIQVSELANILETQVQTLAGRTKLCNELAKKIVTKYDCDSDLQISYDEFSTILRTYSKSTPCPFEDFHMGSQSLNFTPSECEYKDWTSPSEPYFFLHQASGLGSLTTLDSQFIK